MRELCPKKHPWISGRAGFFFNLRQLRRRTFSFWDTMFEQAFKNIDDALRKESGCITELDYTEHYTVTGATLGIPILVREQRDFCFQRHIGLIRPNVGVDGSWLTYALRSPQVFWQGTIGSTGTAQNTVSLGVLRCLKLPKVSLKEQKTLPDSTLSTPKPNVLNLSINAN